MEDTLLASYAMVFVGSFEEDRVASLADNNKIVYPEDLPRVCSLSSLPSPSTAIKDTTVSTKAHKDSDSIRLNPGERRGWWSKHKYDRRTRMRAVVAGAVNDVAVRILLDTGANVSILSTRLARRLGLLKHAQKDKSLNIQGISDKHATTNGQIEVKITLGWKTVYQYTVWISDHRDTSELILGVDFLMPAGIRLDLYTGKAMMPDEVCIPLNNISDARENRVAERLPVSPQQTLMISSGDTKYFRIRLPTDWTRYELWVRRKPKWIPTIIKSKTGVPKYIKITNTEQKENGLQLVSSHDNVGWWVEKDHTPLELGYVRESSRKYREWQILAFESTAGKTFLQREADEFEAWVAEHPALPNKPQPLPGPVTILQRVDRDLTTNKQDLVTVEARPDSAEGIEEARVCAISAEEREEADEFICMSAEQLQKVIEEDQDKQYRHEATQLHAEDLAGQLAMLPEIEDLQPVSINIDEAKIGDGNLTEEQVEQVKEVLRKHQSHLVGGGNAVPKPAKGVVCDIDVGDHPPISLPARRVKPEILVKLFELLKTLLKAGLIKMSRSQWASPIVIVYKKDGETIRLCIDYRAVNRVTKSMAYPMALVDDLLESFEEVMWFCSLDAASGFWAILMTERASDISAFVCPLGHFQWTRMPFGLKNAPMLYQRMLDNALWGFVKPELGWEASSGGGLSEYDKQGRQLDIFDKGSPEDSSLTPIMWRRSFVDDVAFGARTFAECVQILDLLLSRFVQLCICVSFLKSSFCMSRVDFLSHLLSSKGLEIKPKVLTTLEVYPFPKSKKGVQSFLGSLNYYGKFIQDFGVLAATLYEIQDEDFSSGRDLSRAKRSFELLKQRAVSAPVLKHFQPGVPVYIMLFANDWAISATVMQLYDGKYHPVRFVSRVLKQNELGYHLAEKEILALLRVLRVCYTMLVGQELTIMTRYSTLKWLYTQRSLYGRALQFAVMLSPWTFTVDRVDPTACSYAALLTSSIVPIEDLEKTLEDIAPTLRGKTKTGVQTDIPYPLLSKDYAGYLLSFDGSIRKPAQGGYGSCGYVLWKLPEWEVAHAACFHIPEATINMAEYAGLIHGLRHVHQLGITELFVTGDSQIVLTQVTGRKQCHAAHLQVSLNEVKGLEAKIGRVAYLHLLRRYNGAADFLASEALRTKVSRTVDDDITKEILSKLNKLPEGVYIPDNAPSPGDSGPRVVCMAIDHPSLDLADVDSDDGGDGDDDVDTLEVAQLETQLGRVQAEVVTLGEVCKLLDQCYPAEAEPVRIASLRGGDPDCEQDSPSTEPIHQEASQNTAAEPVLRHSESNEFQPMRFDTYDTPAAVQDERFRRLAHAQDEERQWSMLKQYLRGEISALSIDEVKKCEKVAEFFVLDSLDVLRYVGTPKKQSQHPDREPRLVVPTSIQDELLHLAHTSLEGGHQGVVRTYYKLCREYYWPAMYAAVEKYVLECTDCSSGKGKPSHRGSSPGNITPTRPMQVVSMDAAGPFPKSYHGNRYLLLFQCTFTGYVMCKPLATLDSLSVAQAYEECVFRRFGASEVLRHDRAPEFMSEAMAAFNQMIGQRRRATLSYRPQANGQQERSVQTVIKTVRQYTSDPTQRDWDDYAEQLMFAINVSFDFTRKETPFYLIHGWEAKSTLSAMIPAVSSRAATDKDSAEWRRRMRERHQLALKQAYELQVAWKAKRAEMHNARLRRRKSRRHQQPELAEDDDPLTQPESTSLLQSDIASDVEYKPGDAVWMYVARVKDGLSKKLAHLWHGPFRIVRKVDQHCYELDLPAREGYRFYPIVHVARLKPRVLFSERPSVILTDPNLPRLDFDEELLPEDSFEVQEQTDEWEVEEILDDRTQRDQRFSRIRRQYLVKWKGDYANEWLNEDQLSCPALLHAYLEQKKADRRLQQVQLADEPV